jgi:hypothetical protein
VTLADTHNHEYVVSNVANKNGLETFTLQHGLLDLPDTPVSAKRIFVWGEATKRDLVRLGVPDDKIVVAGRPGLDDELRRYAGDGGRIRGQFCETHGLDPRKLVVTYFATNWAPVENRGLFDCFADICDLDVAPAVKLKSNANPRDIQMYRAWLAESPRTAGVPLIVDETPWRCFQASDVIVTCHSTAGMEALAFETIPVVLEKYPYMDLEGMLPHYGDVVVVRDGAELRALVKRLIDDEQYATDLRMRCDRSYRKHFHNAADWDATRYIAETLKGVRDAR